MKLESNEPLLEAIFNWAINRGDGGRWYGPEGIVLEEPRAAWAQPKDYRPAYWAGYRDRTAYYIRDFVHQAVGAHYAGLDNENYNMLYTFVSNAGEETGWFAPWAFNFDGSIYYMDTPNLQHFVRELTAQFELVETVYKLYCLTGDQRYIQDDAIFQFVSHILTDAVDRLDGAVLPEKNGIPEGFGDIFEISATYNERGFHAAEAGDSIAALVSAVNAYAALLTLRGQKEAARQQRQRAEELRHYFNTVWSVMPDNDRVAYAIDSEGNKHAHWYKNGKEIYGGATLIFIPLKKLLYAGERNQKLLDYIDEKETDPATREDNIESLTYLPDLFFVQHQPERAWFWMKYIFSKKDLPHERSSQGTNGDYPELSFTLLSQILEGMLGINVNAAENSILVAPQLPEGIRYIRVTDVPVGDKLYDITVDGDSVSVLEKQL